MLRPEDRQVAEDLKRRLLAAGVPLVEMRAFGSRVRGDFDDESDLDLFVVLRARDRATQEQIVEAAWDVGYEAGYVVSPVVVTVAEMASFPLRVSSLLEAVRSEGVPV